MCCYVACEATAHSLTHSGYLIGVCFVGQVKRCLQEESARIRRYLHPFTYQRIELECHLWLVCDENISFINDSCSEIVQREQWKGDSPERFECITVDGAI